jgi:formylglycine-generating enzyme required for sulfatase activity
LWGNTWDAQHLRANTKESGINGPSVVGIFPHGAAACGAQEMAGNVREWCATPYMDYADYPPPAALAAVRDVDAGAGRIFVVRGGSFFLEQMSCAARDVFDLYGWYGLNGLRVARLFS